MTTCILTFDPTGTGHGLYTEVIDLAAIGTLEIHRATTIEFNNARQMWEVKDNEGEVRYADPSRQTCLAWENRTLG